VVAGQRLDLTARDELHEVTRRRIWARRATDTVAPDRGQLVPAIQHEVVEVFLDAAVELRHENQRVPVEVGSPGDEPAGRPDQAELRGHVSEGLARRVDP